MVRRRRKCLILIITFRCDKDTRVSPACFPHLVHIRLTLWQATTWAYKCRYKNMRQLRSFLLDKVVSWWPRKRFNWRNSDRPYFAPYSSWTGDAIQVTYLYHGSPWIILLRCVCWGFLLEGQFSREIARREGNLLSFLSSAGQQKRHIIELSTISQREVGMSLAFSSSSSVLAGFFSFFSSFFFFVFFLSSSPPPLSSAFHGPQHLTIIEIGFLTLSLTPLFPDNLAPFPGFTLWNKTRTSFLSFRISVSLRLSLDCRGESESV